MHALSLLKPIKNLPLANDLQEWKEQEEKVQGRYREKLVSSHLITGFEVAGQVQGERERERGAFPNLKLGP
ncbi:conserved hypothetical protein [Ricinus communis]|uniref:Uncharacterized protein n=1 Tax=Ricinus communis TaxID=3988 RepID=B9SRU1_RICCO|nr:conserved hypothetical protein [Ricinus communis]